MLIDLVVATLFLASAVVTATYLLYFRKIQRLLETWLPDEWREMGGPQGFSGRDFWAVISVLYSQTFTERFRRINGQSDLTLVRFLFPASMLLNVALIALIIYVS